MRTNTSRKRLLGAAVGLILSLGLGGGIANAGTTQSVPQIAGAVNNGSPVAPGTAKTYSLYKDVNTCQETYTDAAFPASKKTGSVTISVTAGGYATAKATVNGLSADTYELSLSTVAFIGNNPYTADFCNGSPTPFTVKKGQTTAGVSNSVQLSSGAWHLVQVVVFDQSDYSTGSRATSKYVWIYTKPKAAATSSDEAFPWRAGLPKPDAQAGATVA